MGISDDHWIPNTPHINFGKISGDSVEVLLWTSESPHRKFALISLCTRCFNLVLSGICIKHTKRNISLSEVIRWNIQHSLICSIVFLGFSMGFPKKSHPGLKTTTFLKQRQTSDAASATALVDAASRCGSPGIHHAASGVGTTPMCFDKSYTNKTSFLAQRFGWFNTGDLKRDRSGYNWM